MILWIEDAFDQQTKDFYAPTDVASSISCRVYLILCKIVSPLQVNPRI